MNFSKYLPFQYLGVTWRRLALFFITLFTIVSLQHFISEPILSASSSMSSSASGAIASSIVAQASPTDSTSPSSVTYDSLTDEQKALADKSCFLLGLMACSLIFSAVSV